MNRNFLVEPIILGRIGSSYGILGWVKILSFTERIESIFNYTPWFVRKKDWWCKVELEAQHYHGQNVIAKLKGVNNRNAASLLKNCEILIDSSQLPPLKEGEFYWKDLIGCKVITIENHILGSVFDIIETGSNDVLVVKDNLKETFMSREYLIPFIFKRVIKKINLPSREIEVDWRLSL